MQKELKLSPQQVKAFDDAQSDLKKCVEEYPLQAGPRRMQIAKVTKWADETAAAILTAEQKKKWNETLGEPFKGEVKQFPVPGLRPVAFKAPTEK